MNMRTTFEKMLIQVWVFCAEYWVDAAIKLKTWHIVPLYGLNSNARPLYGIHQALEHKQN